jgi:exodeoxyribonuclease VII small subunit
MNPNDSGPPGASAARGATNQETAPERFDDLLVRLRALVDKLESGNLPLEDGLRFFEQGIALCRRGAEILDAAEKRVEVLLAAPADGPARTAPFEDGSRAADDEDR